jgi:7-carboxy-7-deazaguanine synthase
MRLNSTKPQIPMLLTGGIKMKIKEIFYSIQGEGLTQGLPTIFIRFVGCNLRCTYCDTRYAYDGGKEMSADEILAEIKKFNCRRVCLTGGEPLLQADLLKLIDKLKGYEISIETNGSLDVTKYKHKAIISLDIKCPCSGCSDKMHFENLKILDKGDQVKFIVETEKDINFAFDIIKRYNLADKTNVLINPVWGIDSSKIVSLILKSNMDIRFGMQLHKFIWGIEKRGV